MIDTKTMLADPRRRNLAILGAIALVAVALAIFALHEEAGEGAVQYTPREMFRGFASHIREAARIHIVSKQASFDITFKPESGWVIGSRSNYPASFDEVRRTLIGLAALQTIEPKTSNPAWFGAIGVDAPPRGNGVEITVSDDKGKVMAALIAGKSEEIGDASGAIGLFVRRPGDNQTYLARSVFEPKGSPGDWIDKSVVDIDRSRIQQVDVDPAGGGSYSVRRDTPSDADFKLSPIPKGRELANPAAPDAVASGMTGFTFDDIRPASNFDFSKATRVVTRTFDGLMVTVNAIPVGRDVWATVNAQALPGMSGARSEALAIDAHATGWAFKLPPYKAQAFTTPLEAMLKPVAQAAKPGP